MDEFVGIPEKYSREEENIQKEQRTINLEKR
jgi:hypothetical protein